MKKNLKKLLSLLTALTILFTMAGIPAMAEEVTVDFTAVTNIAYGKTVKNTYVSYGHYNVWYSGTTPAVCSDGDIATRASANGGSSGNKTRFTLDLGAVYQISEISLYQGPEARGVNIYTSIESPFAQNKDDEAFAALVTQVGDGTIAAVATTVNGTVCAVNTASSLDVTAQYITFEYPSKYAFTPSEIYVKGTEVTGEVTPDYDALVAADKAALDLGDTSAVTENLTLPTVGSVKNSTITWATNDASVITNTGVITRAAEDKTTTLTATITNGTATDTKTFTVTVAKTESEPEQPGTGGGTEPEVPTGTAVDFTAATNVAYQKTITPKAGRDYYATSSTKPSATSQLATDGDISTWHMAAGRTKLSWGDTVGCEFSMNLGGNKKITSIDLYVQVEGIYTDPGNTGNLRVFPSETINVYGGADATTGTLIGTMTKPADADDYKSITAGGKTMDMYVYHIDFPADAEYSTITFENGTKYNWAYNEIYVTGTEGTTGGGTTEPEEPEIPGIPDGTIDFTAANNIAYGKTLTHINGHYYSSGLAPAATRQFATDGNMNTWHAGYGKVSGQTVGVSFYIDLGKEYELGEVALFVNPAGRGYKVYKGTSVDEAN